MALATRQITQVACTRFEGTNPPPHTHMHKESTSAPCAPGACIPIWLQQEGQVLSRQCSIHSRQEAAVLGELALNRAPCFHFSPVAMGWAWLGQRPPYIGQGRILPPLLLMQSQRTQRRQNKQLPFSGKHISAICLLGVFCLCV